MINVPVEVKDALREGNYKKNYLIQMYKQGYDKNIIDVGSVNVYQNSFTVPEDGDYILYSLLYYYAFTDVTITGSGDPRTVIYIPGEDPDGETWLLLEGLHEGEVLTVHGIAPDLPNVGITMPQYVTYTPAWEYVGVLQNPHLIKESVSIDERMCSGDTLKFGLCEGASLEFQCSSSLIKPGYRLRVRLRIEYGANEPYQIEMGYFYVKSCSRQASTGIIKVTAYNKLQSDYLDADAGILIGEIPSDSTDGKVSLYTIKNDLLKDYSIDLYNSSAVSVLPQTYGGIPRDYEFATMTFKVTGSSTTYYPLVHCQYETIKGYVQTPDFSGGAYMMVKYVPEYAYMLEEAVSKIKQRVYYDIASSDSVWQSLRHYLIYAASAEVVQMINGTEHHIYFTCPTLYEYKSEMPAGADVRLISELQAMDNVSYINFAVPVMFGGQQTNAPLSAPLVLLTMTPQYDLEEIYTNKVSKIDMSNFDTADLIRLDTSDLNDVTLRDLMSAAYETECQFGKLSRSTDMFSGVELNHSRLLPADNLYPTNYRYPGGAAESAFKSQYSKLWADEGNAKKWRYLIITYKGLDENDQEADFTLQRTVNADGTDDYNMSDNWLFRNLVWTAEQVGDYADAMVEKMQDITWFPFEMWCAGLPYLETGDEIEIIVGEHTYTSYILQRQLKGIQNLQDTYINGTLDIF